MTTGQAGINDRHCMCRGLGQARPCSATLMHDVGPVVDGNCQQLASRLTD